MQHQINGFITQSKLRKIKQLSTPLGQEQKPPTLRGTINFQQFYGGLPPSAPTK
jgi:hypothetical protein